MIEIVDLLVPASKQHKSSGVNPVDYITVHQTGNTSRGADAYAHARLQFNGNRRQASWHYSVDDGHKVYRSYSDESKCWHAGDGGGAGNMRSIGIELCINSDGDYSETIEHGAELVAQLLKKHKLDIGRVVQHNHWSGKNCPQFIRGNVEGISWGDFLNKVRGYLGVKPSKPSKPKPTPAKKPSKSPSGKLKIDGLWGKNVNTKLQKVLGTPIDGEIWNQPIRWKSKNPGLTTGWKWVNNPKSSPAIAALQRYLNKKGFNLVVDGLIGPATISALQKYYDTPVDGEIWKNSPVVKKMQAALNKGTI